MNKKVTGKTRIRIIARFRQFEGSPKARRALVDTVAADYGISTVLIYRILREAGVALEWRRKRSVILEEGEVAPKTPPSLSALVTAARKATISLADHSRVLDARVRNHTALLADLRS